MESEVAVCSELGAVVSCGEVVLGDTEVVARDE